MENEDPTLEKPLKDLDNLFNDLRDLLKLATQKEFDDLKVIQLLKNINPDITEVELKLSLVTIEMFIARSYL